MEYVIVLVLEVESDKNVDFSETLVERLFSVIDGQVVVCEEGRSVMRVRGIEVVKSE